MEIFFCILLFVCTLACWFCERRIKSYQQAMKRLHDQREKENAELKAQLDELAKNLRVYYPTYHYHEN